MLPSIARRAVDRLAEQIRMSAMARVLLDHVDNGPAERVLSGLGFADVAVVHARRGEMRVDTGDLAPVGAQRVGDGGVRGAPPFLVVIEKRWHVLGEENSPE